MSGFALTCWLLSNCCQHTEDSVTNTLKMYDLCRDTANKNDKAHCIHGQCKLTLTEINKRQGWTFMIS